MKLARLAQVVLLALVLLAGFGCGSDRMPTAVPSMEPAAGVVDAGVVDDVLQATGLLRCSPLPYAVTRQKVGPRGGQLRVGPHVLVIPPGALAEQVTIVAEAPVGTVNSVRLSPHGLQFRVPAALTMSYANCNLLGLLLPKRIAYTSEALQILSFITSIDNIRSKKVTGTLDHFSRYAIAW